MHVLVACAPKTGSSFISEFLCRLLEIPRGHLLPGYGSREQELDIKALEDTNHLSYVAQHHLRYGEVTGELLKNFEIKPIVLTRSVFDCIISYADHVMHDQGLLPLCHFEPGADKRDMVEITDALVDVAAPWYFQFVRAWAECRFALHVRYEAFFDDPWTQTRRIADFLDVEVTQEQVAKAWDATLPQGPHFGDPARGPNGPRFNVGERGRGRRMLSAAQIQRIESYARHFPGTDFSALDVVPGAAASQNEAETALQAADAGAVAILQRNNEVLRKRLDFALESLDALSPHLKFQQLVLDEQAVLLDQKQALLETQAYELQAKQAFIDEQRSALDAAQALIAAIEPRAALVDQMQTVIDEKQAFINAQRETIDKLRARIELAEERATTLDQIRAMISEQRERMAKELSSFDAMRQKLSASGSA